MASRGAYQAVQPPSIGIVVPVTAAASSEARNRSYDPVLGRFIGRDTFGGVMSAPQTGNRYAYAASNPLRYTDPSGHLVNAAITAAPRLIEVAMTFNPVGAILMFGYQLVTGTDPATGARIDPSEALLGVALTFGPIAAAKVVGNVIDAFRASRGLAPLPGTSRCSPRGSAMRETRWRPTTGVMLNHRPGTA